MREAAAQAVQLARAFEEADANGLLLPMQQRQSATEAARGRGGAEEQAGHRAALLLSHLQATAPGLSGVLATTRLPLRLLLPLPLLAFALGAATNALGPDRHVNILSFPLLGILAWNLAVYLGLLSLAAARASRAKHDNRAAEPSAWRGSLGALASRVAAFSIARVRLPDAPRSAIAARALHDYWRRWAPLAAPLVATRIRFALHLSAAFLVLGAVAGMYARGLTYEYRATWESTFLGPDAAAWLLHVVLGPAAALVGSTLPDAAQLAAMRTPADAPAASWIHLWALTATLVVLLPRGVLAMLAWRRQSGLAESLDVDPFAGSFRVLLAPDRGAGLAIEVLRYSYAVEGRAADRLRELLHDVFGLRAEILFPPALAYGAEPDGRQQPAAPACSVLVFGLVQSPEREVHGDFAKALLERAPRVLAIVDASAWQERFGDGDEQRRSERRRAWDRVLNEAGLSPLHLNLAAPLTTSIVEEAEKHIAAARGAAA